MEFGPDDLQNCGWLTLPRFDSGAAGSLFVAEHGSGALPFEFRRAYFITGMAPDAVRGAHAHKTLRQAIFAASGSFRLDLDDGRRRTNVLVDQPQRGVYLGPMLWHEMTDFSPGCVIVVFAADPYDPSDYIRDYMEFMRTLARARRGG